jgi:hypothetical protein
MTIASLSTRELRRELARRESGAAKLSAQHADLSKQMAALEAELADLGVDAPARRGRKPGRMGKRGPGRPKGIKNKPGKVGRPKGSKNKNAMSLVEAILKGVRAGSTVSPAEAGAAAKRVGYKSSSPNFGMMVANALSKDGHFKRIERGQYQVGGGKAAAKPTAKKAMRKGKRASRKPGKAKAAATTALAEVVAR